MSKVDITAECTNCLERIPKQAQKCPECGYEIQVGWAGAVWILVGFILSITLVGAILGIPMMTYGALKRWYFRSRKRPASPGMWW